MFKEKAQLGLNASDKDIVEGVETLKVRAMDLFERSFGWGM